MTGAHGSGVGNSRDVGEQVWGTTEDDTTEAGL